MKECMERWYLFTGQRCSIRKYQSSPSSRDIFELLRIAEQLSTDEFRIVIKKNKSVFVPIFLNYGKVSGTGLYAAFVAKKCTPDYIIGYLGEAFVLECCAMGFGTCWLGGSFKKGLVQSEIELHYDEYISCITPIGIPNERYIGRPRKPLDKLTGLTQEQLQSLPEWQVFALDCARLAPSALNCQPWRFMIDGDNITVECISNNYGFGKLDCGIAMLHIELGAAHGGVFGEWTVSDDAQTAVFMPK